jgi:hypothetical protein
MSPVNTTQRLEKLRQLFDKNQFNIDAYVVPSEDAHYVIIVYKKYQFYNINAFIFLFDSQNTLLL